jgi:hypothetical protein
MGYRSGMLRTQMTRAGALAGALLATGCLGDLFQLPLIPAPVEAPPGTRVAALWELAPADAVAGVVVHDGALGRALALWADADRSPGRVALEELLQERGKLPFGPLSPEAWTGAGLDPQKGAAAFSFADKKRGALLVLPVTDRAAFRRAFGLLTRPEGDREVDQLNDETVCEPAAGRYLCARGVEAIAAAAAPHASPLAKGAEEIEEHGEVELQVSRDAPDVTHFNHGPDSPGWVTGIAGAFHLRDDGASLHLRARGSLATPRARGLYAAPPPPALVAAARGAASVGRIHVDPALLLPPAPQVEPEVRSELIEQLTGDAEMIPAGAGFAGATILLPVHDAPRVEAFVKKRCAESAAGKERRPLGDFKVTRHGCAAAFDASRQLIPVKIPVVPVAVTVADGRLVVVIGDPGKDPPAGRGDRPPVDGAATRSSLEDAETLLFFGHNLGLGPEVGAGAMVRAAIPLLGERIAPSVEAWDYVSAHVSQALVRARVTDEEAELTIDLTSFAADPPAARAAYDAALARRFAGDDPGYRAALAALEKSAPGTRAARRAAEVRAGAPFFGAGVALLGTLAALEDVGKKPKPK